MNIVRLIVIILSIYPLTMTYGISGTCLSVLLGIISACFVWLYASIRETNTTYKDYLAIIFPPVMGTIFMCGIVVTVLRVDNYIEKDLLTFLIAIIIGAISYFGMMILIEKNLNYHGLQVLKDVYNTLLKDEVKYH
jgi:O-antigen/teichoic acid export membrane protein